MITISFGDYKAPVIADPKNTDPKLFKLINSLDENYESIGEATSVLMGMMDAIEVDYEVEE